MIGDNLIDSEELNVRSLLAYDQHYEIPLFQRDFSWTDENINEFIADLLLHYTESRNEQYYFGIIFLHVTDDKDKFIVIDGQQRLTTTLIFLIAARDLFEELHLRSSVDQLNQNIFYDKSSRIPRLKLNNRNNKYFINNIINKSQDNDGSQYVAETNEKLKKTYVKIYEKLKTMVDNSKNGDVDVYGLVNYFLKNFIITVNTIQEKDKHRVFDSVNNKGLKLSENDFVKNSLFEILERNNEDLEYYHDQWAQMLNNIENARIDINKFLRDYLIAYHKRVRKKYVSQTILELVKNDIWSPSKLIDELCRISLNYYHMINPPDKFIVKPQLSKNLYTLKILESKSVYSVLLIGYDKLKTIEDFDRLTEIMTKFFFRSRTICKTEANAMEKIMERICRMLRNPHMPLTDDFMGAISSFLTQRSEYHKNDFKDYFKLFNTNNDMIISYVLSEINKKMSNDDTNLSNLSIEHIMPKILDTTWKSYLKSKLNITNDIQLADIHKNYLSKIGNMTLVRNNLTVDHNSLYDEKLRNMYKNSELTITNSISYDDWTFTEINNRQTLFADHADKIWSL